MQVHFDPSQISYDALLERFWSGHDPTSARGSQYRAALFCDNDIQLAAARRSASAWERANGEKVATEITAHKPFHPAEAYHQKWRLRRRSELFAELQTHYPTEPDLLASVAAAKLNGYVGTRPSPAQLDRDLPRLGLSPETTHALASLAKG